MENQTMRALRADRPDVEALVVESVPVPVPGTGDVLLRVQAASFTPTELSWPSTWVDRLGRDRRPTIPGHEVAGLVEALGSGATRFAVGDAVYGLTDWYRDGAAAEYVAVEARNLAPMPATLDAVEAAAVPLAGLTAYQALFDHGRLATGQTALVHGAAGGVGTYLVQLAKAAGARVVATGREWARDLATGLGADVFVDVDTERFESVAGEVDLVVDAVGGKLLERSWSVLRPGGTLISVAEVPTPPAEREDVRSQYFIVEPDRAELAELSRRIDAGELRPVVGSVLPLAEGAQAFRAKHAGGVHGKAVLQIG